MWNKEHEKTCTLCNHNIESVAHLTSSCRKFKDLYSRRHDRIVNTVSEEIQKSNPASQLFVNKMAETVFPALRNEIEEVSRRKPDIIELKENEKECEIIDITVFFICIWHNRIQRRIPESRYQRVKIGSCKSSRQK